MAWHVTCVALTYFCWGCGWSGGPAGLWLHWQKKKRQGNPQTALATPVLAPQHRSHHGQDPTRALAPQRRLHHRPRTPTLCPLAAQHRQHLRSCALAAQRRWHHGRQLSPRNRLPADVRARPLTFCGVSRAPRVLTVPICWIAPCWLRSAGRLQGVGTKTTENPSVF